MHSGPIRQAQGRLFPCEGEGTIVAGWAVGCIGALWGDGSTDVRACQWGGAARRFPFPVCTGTSFTGMTVEWGMTVGESEIDAVAYRCEAVRP